MGQDEDQLKFDGAGGGATTRRALLVGGGAVCVAMLLGACGSADPNAPAVDADGGVDEGGTTPDPVESTASGSGDGGGGNGGGGAEVIAKVKDLPAGGGKIVSGILLVNLGGGKIKAYDPHCTHQGFVVDPPKNGIIVCENHGSQYKASDGSVIMGPAQRPLRAINVKVEGGNIVRA